MNIGGSLLLLCLTASELASERSIFSSLRFLPCSSGSLGLLVLDLFATGGGREGRGGAGLFLMLGFTLRSAPGELCVVLTTELEGGALGVCDGGWSPVSLV